MRVRVLVAFNGMRVGDEGHVSEGGQELARGYASAGLLEVIEDGESTGGPGGSAPGDSWGEPAGADERG